MQVEKDRRIFFLKQGEARDDIVIGFTKNPGTERLSQEPRIDVLLEDTFNQIRVIRWDVGRRTFYGCDPETPLQTPNSIWHF